MRPWSYSLPPAPMPIDFCPHCRSRDGFRHTDRGEWICFGCSRVTTPREFDRLVDPWTLEPRRPPERAVTEWSPEAQTLIDWFISAGRELIPSEPFRLAPHIRVTEPAKFAAALAGDIEAGPERPRAVTGALLGELRMLRAFLEAQTAGSAEPTPLPHTRLLSQAVEQPQPKGEKQQ